MSTLYNYNLSIQMNKCLLENQKLWQQKYDEMDEKSRKLEAAKDTVCSFCLFIKIELIM